MSPEQLAMYRAMHLELQLVGKPNLVVYHDSVIDNSDGRVIRNASVSVAQHATNPKYCPHEQDMCDILNTCKDACYRKYHCGVTPIPDPNRVKYTKSEIVKLDCNPMSPGWVNVMCKMNSSSNASNGDRTCFVDNEEDCDIAITRELCENQRIHAINHKAYCVKTVKKDFANFPTIFS